jgi:hypothetical protein
MSLARGRLANRLAESVAGNLPPRRPAYKAGACPILGHTGKTRFAARVRFGHGLSRRGIKDSNPQPPGWPGIRRRLPTNGRYSP